MATTPDKTENRGQADGRGAPWKALGDFTTTVRVLPISGLSSCDWAPAAFVALALLRLIGDACPSWCFAREVVHLGRFAWLGRFRRSSGSVAHDGRGAWRT